MSNQNNFSSEDPQLDLIELLLKRQGELNALLEVTRAINTNVPGKVLLEMLEYILKTNLKIGRFRLLLKEGKDFICVSQFGGRKESASNFFKIGEELLEIKTPSKISDHPDTLLNPYEYFIPVCHKEVNLAYILVGDFDTSEMFIGNKIDYIQTLINVIVVALENKKLFRERIQKERLQRELELAGHVQNMLIPQSLPKDAVLEVEATYRPHQNIGGDFFDYIELNEDEILWCVADVSGKGISAALIMSNFQASLRALISADISIVELASRLNKLVFLNTKGERFITLFLAKYHKSSRLLEYINAGHNASLLIADGKISSLNQGTTMIGAFEDLPFIKVGTAILKENTIIFNYTDGVVECDGDEEKSLPEEELTEWLLQNNHLPLKIMHEKLIDHIECRRDSKIATDDITVLSLRIH